MIVSKTPSLMDSLPVNREQGMSQSSQKESAAVGETDQSFDFSNILERIQAKEVRALELLHAEMANMLMGVIYNVLKNQAEAEDILQEAFVTIWNKAEQYRPALGKPKSWIITVARNKALDRYRSLSRKSEGQADFQNHLKTNKIESHQTEKNEQLELALQKLNKEQKEAIELVFFKGLTQQEAATQLETPLGTIKARVRRGLQFLKQNLTSTASHG